MAEAEGFWASAAIPGVGVRRVWVSPDEVEQRAAAKGLVRLEVACNVLGRQPSYVRAMAGSGVLAVRDFGGREWIDRDSLDALLSRVGFPSDEERALELAEERGDRYTAGMIRERMQARATEWNREMGIATPEPMAQTSRSAEPSGPSLASFVAEFGRKIGGR